MEATDERDDLHLVMPAAASSPELSQKTDDLSCPSHVLKHVQQQVDSIVNSVFGENNILEVSGVLVISTQSFGKVKIPINRPEHDSLLDSTGSPGAFDGSLSSEVSTDTIPEKYTQMSNCKNKRKNTKPMRVDPTEEKSVDASKQSACAAEFANNLSYTSPQDTPLDLCLNGNSKKIKVENLSGSMLQQCLSSPTLPPISSHFSFPFSFFPMFSPAVPDAFAAMNRPAPMLSPEFLASQMMRNSVNILPAKGSGSVISPVQGAHPEDKKVAVKSENTQKIKRIRSVNSCSRGKRNGASKSFRCNQCSLTFPSLAMLSKHTYSSHSAFRCMICGSNFTQRSNLQRHSLKHVGFKPFICNICGREYYRKDHLVRHIELTHPGQEPRTNITSKLSSSESLDYLDRRDGRLPAQPAQQGEASPATSSCNEDQIENMEIDNNTQLSRPTSNEAGNSGENCESSDVDALHAFNLKNEVMYEKVSACS